MVAYFLSKVILYLLNLSKNIKEDQFSQGFSPQRAELIYEILNFFF